MLETAGGAILWINNGTDTSGGAFTNNRMIPANNGEITNLGMETSRISFEKRFRGSSCSIFSKEKPIINKDPYKDKFLITSILGKVEIIV